MTDGAREFIERMGLVAEEQGIPRIGGRMLGYLLLQKEQKSLEQIAEDLQVSKASVSLNARCLERLGVVEKVSSPGDRRDYYRIVERPWERIYAAAQEQIQRTHDVLELQVRLLGEEDTGRRRVQEWHGSTPSCWTISVEVERWLSPVPPGGAEPASPRDGQGDGNVADAIRSGR